MRRGDVPEALADPASWPAVDISALDHERRDVYERREQAVSAYLRGESRIDIERLFGVNRASLTRLVGRCLSPHQDGRIQGLRALIPHTRAKAYRRVKRAVRSPSSGGLSGALGQLFERLPQLIGIIEREISGSALGLSKNNRIHGLSDVQSKIIAACREAGLTAKDYPLNHDEMGYRSLARWIRIRLEQRIPMRLPRQDEAWNTTTRPYSVVELDGHKLDLRVRVRYIDATGVSVDIESERLFVITLIDVCTRVVLGWQLVPAPEYDHHDVLCALQDALRPRLKRQEFSIPGLGYRTGAGFVADVLPELNFACWDVLKVDNAASHLTEDTFEPICRFVNCRLEAGPIGEPTSRPFIERFFGTLTERMSRKIVGTTGRSPDDPLGKRGRAVPVPLLITLPELEELLDVSIANYHATAHAGLNGRSPLEALQLAITHHATPVRVLPSLLRGRLHQLQSVHLSTVRGNAAHGVPPYVSLYGARYSNEVLQRTSGLIQQKIRVYIQPNDMREAWAYLSNGADLGRLFVLDGWRYSRHTLRLRKRILRERRLGRLKFAGEQDPVQLFADAQRRTSRRGRKQGTLELQLDAARTASPSPSASPSPVVRSPAPTAAPAAVPIDLGDLKMQNN
jgi:putative transposase